MPQRKPAWDMLSDASKQTCLDRIVAYFFDTRGEQIGMIAAEDLLQKILECAYADAYNKGVHDTQKLVQERNADLDADIDVLLRIT